MFSAESRISMTMLTAIAVFTCTWLFANASITPCPQALDCMMTISQSSSCRDTETVFACLSSLRGTCSVNESKVAFKDVVQPTKDMCNAIANHPSDVGSCSTFWPCREKTTFAQVMEASPWQQREMSGHLVSSYTFCRYAEDMAACFVSENEAGRCTFSTAFLNYMMNTKHRLSKLCEGN
ncbi:uncharacterized protein LOC112559910 isoform X2 [Pomacea canaliculata]|uniref:uncharacterized protein LOC112559910 isoform X2 n=1 Tax=Pomacea canaliculata TaxID=400727 RepID=UPI000D72E00E|nr:uncharacterized protein LOC112559910 isoform X2 [Pomacea canaliculata]